MREILFRGKRKKGDKRWVEGDLLHGYSGFGITNRYYAGSSFEVVPETVGQYTGLTDKNGARIFEGDIVSGHLDDLFPEDESRYEIAWIDYGWHLTNLGGTVDTAEQDWVNQNFEVIGNIYDNPELMGGEAHG